MIKSRKAAASRKACKATRSSAKLTSMRALLCERFVHTVLPTNVAAEGDWPHEPPDAGSDLGINDHVFEHMRNRSGASNRRERVSFAVDARMLKNRRIRTNHSLDERRV